MAAADLDAMVEELLALEVKATPGPAEPPQSRHIDPKHVSPHQAFVVRLQHANGPWDCCWFYRQDDAALIVAMRNALPALLEECAALKREVSDERTRRMTADHRVNELLPLTGELKREVEELRQQNVEAKTACSALYQFMQRDVSPPPGEVDRIIGLVHTVIPEEVERDWEATMKTKNRR